MIKNKELNTKTVLKISENIINESKVIECNNKKLL